MTADATRMFITDFDGTLLTDQKTIASHDLETLALLRADGTVTVIATGRSLFSFRRALNVMGLNQSDLPVDYLLFSTGAGIYSLCRDEIILSQALSKDEILNITDYFGRIGIDYSVQDAIPRTEYFLFKSHGMANPDFNRRIALYPTLGRPFENKEEVFESATQVLAIVPGGIGKEELARIRLDLKDFSVILATSPLDHESAWVEVFPKAVSKSRSAAWLASRLGIDRENITAVGNDYNDMDLLEWAGRGFLVENGPEDMKSRFRTVASNNACGVSRAAMVSALPV